MEVVVRASSWEPEAKGSNVHTSTIDENTFHHWHACFTSQITTFLSLPLCLCYLYMTFWLKESVI